jgi:hypothetical protein
MQILTTTKMNGQTLRRQKVRVLGKQNCEFARLDCLTGANEPESGFFPIAFASSLKWMGDQAGQMRLFASPNPFVRSLRSHPCIRVTLFDHPVRYGACPDWPG